MALLEKDRDLEFPHIFIIEASAGSGKTHALTQRFVQFLLSEAIPNSDLSNILAITFTNNAAREMKERILNWLKNLALGLDREVLRQTLELVSVPEDRIPSLADRVIDRILQDYTDFHVQTIDSFMRRIFSASAIELGFPPEVEIQTSYEDLVEYTLSLMLREVGTGGNRELTRTFEEFLNSLELPGRRYKWNPYGSLKDELNSLIDEESKRIKAIGFPELTERNMKDNVLDELSEIFRSILDRAEGLLDRKTDSFSLEKAIAEGNVKKILDRKTFFLKKPKERVNLPLWEALGDQWQDALHRAKGKLARYISIFNFRGYAELFPLFKEKLEETKKRRGIIHISDLNKKLSDYIQSDTVPEIYFRLGDTLYHFLMDEFQDTDAVQWENLKPLIGEALSKGGSFFAVGDLKQAIYMFKNADYRIMKKLVESERDPDLLEPEFQSARENITVARLETNYRSDEKILEFVEHTFKDRLASLLDVHRERYDRTGLTSFEQNVHESRRGKGYVKTARIVKDKNTEGEPERDKLIETVKDVLKRYNPGDIAILARKEKEVEKIIGWLIEEGINAASFSSLDLRKRKIAGEIVNLLRFLDSPIDELAFSQFLLGRIMERALGKSGMGIASIDLQHFIFRTKKDTPDTLIYIALRDDPVLGKIWSRFFEELYKKVGYTPLYDLLVQIYRTFSIPANFPEEAGFLARLLESANDLEARGMNSIKDFLEIYDKSSGEAFEIILPEFIDAVKVMTFHKSKGLGFPVVINLIYEERNRSDNKLFIERGDQIVLYYVTTWITPHFDAIREHFEESQLEDKIQTLNLYYVITTRAKHELYNIIVCSREKCDEPASHWKDLNTPSGIKPLDIFEKCEMGEKSLKGRPQREIPSYTSLEMGTGAQPYEEKGRKAEEWTKARIEEVQRGEFIHEVMRKIEFLDRLDSELLGEILERTANTRRDKYDLEEIEKKITEFLKLPGVMDWFFPAESREVLCEVEIVDDKGNTHRIDRLILDSDTATVIDYKTGTEQPEEYESQIRLYMDLVKKIYPGREVKGYLAYIDLLQIQEVRP